LCFVALVHGFMWGACTSPGLCTGVGRIVLFLFMLLWHSCCVGARCLVERNGGDGVMVFAVMKRWCYMVFGWFCGGEGVVVKRW